VQKLLFLSLPGVEINVVVDNNETGDRKARREIISRY
jgi:hypothetical protein